MTIFGSPIGKKEKPKSYAFKVGRYSATYKIAASYKDKYSAEEAAKILKQKGVALATKIEYIGKD